MTSKTRAGRHTGTRSVTIGDLAARWLLKATLYAFLLALLPILLDMHYNTVNVPTVCMGHGYLPGRWDCHLARQLGPDEVDVLHRVGDAVVGKIEHRQ